MSVEQCPICFSPLEVRDVAPCAMCGAVPVEIDHAREGVHTFAEYRILGDISLVLCNFCQVDMDSIHPEYWGESNTRRIGFADLQLVRQIVDVHVGRDKYCPECGQRLALLAALKKIRELNAA
jgi:hypothetical protein